MFNTFTYQHTGNNEFDHSFIIHLPYIQITPTGISDKTILYPNYPTYGFALFLDRKTCIQKNSSFFVFNIPVPFTRTQFWRDQTKSLMCTKSFFIGIFIKEFLKSCFYSQYGGILLFHPTPNMLIYGVICLFCTRKVKITKDSTDSESLVIV